MRSAPACSIFMTVKNGMPFVRDALDSVCLQTYDDFELIVQDGASVDGTLEVLREYVLHPKLRNKIQIESRYDESLSEAKYRAIERCTGDIITTVDADNLLSPNAVELAVKYLQENSDVAALYGSQRMINEKGVELSVFNPKPFDLLNHLQCIDVPPFGSSYFRSCVTKDLLYPPRDLLLCADYELWIKISHLRIDTTHTVLASTRVCQNSITCNAENYEQMCSDKILALGRYLQAHTCGSLKEVLQRRCISGIYLWAAASIGVYFPMSNHEYYFRDYIEKAFKIDPTNPRINSVIDLYRGAHEAA